MTILPERIPTMNAVMTYQGSFSDLPRAGTNGDMLYNTNDNKIYAFLDNRWVFVADMITKSNLIDDLTEVLDKYPDSSIGKEVRILLEAHRRKSYV